MPSHYVLSDVHGHPDALVEAVRAVGLVDAEGNWCGEDELWVLGDYFDRGPDGIAVVDLLRRWQGQATEPGAHGRVEALLGNHEVLALGMRWFGEERVPGRFDSRRSFLRSWSINGGRESDQIGLTEDRIAWLLARPLVARVGDWLLLHSDTTEYLAWGATLDEVNDGGRAAVGSRDLEQVWDVWRRMTSRGAFEGRDGEAAVSRLLDSLGGTRIIHGHSTIGDMLDLPGSLVRPEPRLYADGRAVGVDGGLYDGGPLIVVRLEDL